MFDYKKFRLSFSLTQSELASILKCGQPNISSMEKTMKDLEPSHEKILIEKFGENSVRKFVFNGDIIPKNNKSTKKEENNNINDNLSTYETWLLPMDSHGGSLTGIPAEGAMPQNCERIISPIKDVDFAITVYGDSMAPEYPSGSKVLIKKINPEVFIEWGRTFVLDTSNGVLIKEVHYCEREGYITCHSINNDPKYKDFDIPLSEIYGMYRVLMVMAAK